MKNYLEVLGKKYDKSMPFIVGFLAGIWFTLIIFILMGVRW